MHSPTAHPPPGCPIKRLDCGRGAGLQKRKKARNQSAAGFLFLPSEGNYIPGVSGAAAFAFIRINPFFLY